jgi:hypothetical protein
VHTQLHTDQVDPRVFFSALFGSELFEAYIGEMLLASIATMVAEGGAPPVPSRSAMPCVRAWVGG